MANEIKLYIRYTTQNNHIHNFITFALPLFLVFFRETRQEQWKQVLTVAKVVCVCEPEHGILDLIGRVCVCVIVHKFG